jgi:hypothetical protein
MACGILSIEVAKACRSGLIKSMYFPQHTNGRVVSSESEYPEQAKPDEMDALSRSSRERMKRYEALRQHHNELLALYRDLLNQPPTSPARIQLRQAFRQALRDHHQMVLAYRQAERAFDQARRK